MQRNYSLISFCVFLFSFFFVAEAHFAGMPIFKINGVFALPAIFDNTLEYAELRDRAPEESYPVGTSLQYEIEPAYIPITDTTLKKTTFIWDFGDGTTQSGLYLLHQSHVYDKDGIYTLKISIDTSSAGYKEEPRVIQVIPITIGNPQFEGQAGPGYLVAAVEENNAPPFLLWNIVGGVVLFALIGGLVMRKNKKQP